MDFHRFMNKGGDHACVQDKYDAKLQLAPLKRTSFRSSQAESERFRIPQWYNPLCAATFAWQMSTLHT